MRRCEAFRIGDTDTWAASVDLDNESDPASRSSRRHDEPLASSNQAALCVVPPPELWPRLQSIREKQDKAFERWPPHINVMFPFVHVDNFQEVAAECYRALAGVRPFDVTLSAARSFPHGTVWVDPAPLSGNKEDTWDELTSSLAALPCLSECSDGRPSFTPHLTVGQWPKNGLSEATASVSDALLAPDEATFACSHVYLMWREGREDPFSIRALIPLGGRDGLTTDLDWEYCCRSNTLKDQNDGGKPVFLTSAGALPSPDAQNHAGSELGNGESLLSKKRATGRSPMAIHFVIDNSGSMGRMTSEIRTIFSGLVDSAATRPCSLTLFSGDATLLSSNINSSKEMLDLPDVRQGSTNIPAGVRAAMKVIAQFEKDEEASGVAEKTHHILILLTDGNHNNGKGPSVEFPLIAQDARKTIPSVQLSVVVVGITRNSNTSMGMLLKTSLETVPLDVDTIENVYFAMTRTEMKTVTASLVDGLNTVSTGRLLCVSHPNRILLPGVGGESSSSIKVRTTPKDTRLTILLECKEAPEYLIVDGEKMAVEAAETDYELIADTLSKQIQQLRIKKVASNQASSVRSAVARLGTLIDALDQEFKRKQQDGPTLRLSGASPRARMEQHRSIIRTVYMAKELRNQLADVENFTANSSEAQAAFLTGRQSKYAARALRRAAARTSDGLVLDAEKELKRVHGEITSEPFAERVKALLRCDAVAHLARLSDAQVQILMQTVRKSRRCDVVKLRSLLDTDLVAGLRAPINGNSKTPVAVQDNLFANVDDDITDFVDTGSLSEYLNEAFFGGRRSYLSLSSPWEQIAEWIELPHTDDEFKSQWEVLLYVGSVGYPITVERSAGTQMNPFQMAVKKVHATMVDTASLCCANHSEIDTYGPEAGEPIKDVLVLVDPSCPAASAKITSSALLGETYTSVVLSRDLHMYTGASMKAALHAHSLFRCVQLGVDKTKSDVAAEIRREFLGKAYQCGSCGLGPVDHGGCSDLFSHHEEVDAPGVVANNACPFCGWFSEYLSDWEEWDGTIPEAFLEERMEGNQTGKRAKPLEATMDMVLRILYSFRKTFPGSGNPFRTWYRDLAKRLVEWDLRFTTVDEVDGLVQVLIAAMACDDDAIGDEKDIEAAFAPPVILAIVNEACARAARKRFRMGANGDDGKAKELAADYVTKMLDISEESAPTTTESLLEPEPKREEVEEACCRMYSIEGGSGENERAWVMKLANRWCNAFSFARALRSAIVKRGGGWTRLERDMETSLDNYSDVVCDLRDAPLPTFFEFCDIAQSDAKRTLTTMAAQAFLHSKGSSRQDLPDVQCGETLKDIARDMRMRIYSKRVQAKMACWRDEGEKLAFGRARAADIGQYTEMLHYSNHVHGLSREMFWALWDAAVYDGHGGEKVRAFIATANDGFRKAYAPESGEVYCRRTRKKK